MKIGSGGVMKIAEMICGDDPFDYFPNTEGYRDLSNELFKRLKTILKIP